MRHTWLVPCLLLPLGVEVGHVHLLLHVGVEAFAAPAALQARVEAAEAAQDPQAAAHLEAEANPFAEGFRPLELWHHARHLLAVLELFPAQLVVDTTLVCVFERHLCLFHFLEGLVGLGCRVFIGVKLDGTLAIGFLDVVVCCVFLDAQDLVVVV